MKLNTATGNMYDFIDYTGNAIRGNCPHNCKYCFNKMRGDLGNIELYKDELKGKMAENKFIFIGDVIDMFADEIPDDWIRQILDYCNCFNNKYLFQSKNPKKILDFINHSVFSKSVVCTTIESNRYYPKLMSNSPAIEDRVSAMEKISNTQIIPYQKDLFDTSILLPRNIETYVTIEPIMKFDLPILVDQIKRCNPTQVNIGANSKEYIVSFREDEPSYKEVTELINELSKFTEVKKKSNLGRLLRH